MERGMRVQKIAKEMSHRAACLMQCICLTIFVLFRRYVYPGNARHPMMIVVLQVAGCVSFTASVSPLRIAPVCYVFHIIIDSRFFAVE